MKASQWIDRVKTVRGWDSDYRVAKELSVTRQTISSYRARHDATMDEEIAFKVAMQLDIDPIMVILDQAAERARTEDTRQAITGLLRKISGAAAAVALVIGAGAPPPANAHTERPASVDYVKRRRRSAFALLADSLTRAMREIATLRPLQLA